ncbi:MAG: DUF2156 domain-containing protein [Oscillospiraceae bacterium]|nr:DUF2156 domain-containing protein [Candidatus Ruminococcus equi]
MLNFKTPELDDREAVQKIVEKTRNMGNDLSFANLFLLRKKYDTKICFDNGFLLRTYNGPYNRVGYAFPLGKGDIEKEILILKQYAENKGEKLQFCFLSEKQKNLLCETYKDEYEFSFDEGDCDYIYKTQKLADLVGNKYHKHKNKCLKFEKTYENIRACKIDEKNIEDAYKVEEMWLSEHSEDKMIIIERDAIKEALANMDALELFGLIIYVDETPVAMSIASQINHNTCDIHFEKSYGEFADNGAYSFICREMAKNLVMYKYLNREEDLNMEGLRQSKMSYHPTQKYKKFLARSK